MILGLGLGPDGDVDTVAAAAAAAAETDTGDAATSVRDVSVERSDMALVPKGRGGPLLQQRNQRARRSTAGAAENKVQELLRIGRQGRLGRRYLGCASGRLARR